MPSKDESKKIFLSVSPLLNFEPKKLNLHHLVMRNPRKTSKEYAVFVKNESNQQL